MGNTDRSRLLEEELTWEVVHAGNIPIGKSLDYEPEISHSVCRDGGCCYSPENVGGYFDSVYSQKQECDRWLEE